MNVELWFHLLSTHFFVSLNDLSFSEIIFISLSFSYTESDHSEK